MSHDVVFKYALPAMSVAMATFIIHCVTFVAIYRVIKYAYRKSELKAVEKVSLLLQKVTSQEHLLEIISLL